MAQATAVTRNEAGTAVVGKPALSLATFFDGTGIQLFGEELVTILPFLSG